MEEFHNVCIQFAKKFDHQLKSLAFKLIAIKLAKAGNIKQALEIANKEISAQNDQIKALSIIAKEYIKIGNIEKAEEIIQRLPEWIKFEVLQFYLTFLLDNQKFDEVRDLITINDKERWHLSLLVDKLKSWMDNLQINEVVRLFNVINDIKLERILSYAISQRLIENNQFDLFIKFVINIKNENLKYELLGYIGEILVSTYDFDENIENVMEIARLISETSANTILKHQALERLIDLLISKGLEDEATKITAYLDEL